MSRKPRLLTGDTPSGRLHLGHLTGSLENRIKLQSSGEYDCFFLIANLHAFSTAPEHVDAKHQSVMDIVLDYMAAGIDPEKSAIVLESDVPAISELTVLFSMLTPYSRAMRNPTIKDEIRDKQLGEHYSLGFLLYQVIQAADILAFQADIVPVGEDQLPHLELTREVARKFNQLYCGVDPHADDSDAVKLGGLFPIPDAIVGRVKRLVGTGGPDAQGNLLKMSKSLNNSILLSDDNDTIRKKVMGMYTDPNRLKATDPGQIEGNPLWIFHDTFNEDKSWVEETKAMYSAGQIGDVDCKKKLVDVLVALIEPMATRRRALAEDPSVVARALAAGAERARSVTDNTMQQLRALLKLHA